MADMCSDLTAGVAVQQQDAADTLKSIHDLLVHDQSDRHSIPLSFQAKEHEQLYSKMLQVGSRNLKRANDPDGYMTTFLAQYLHDVLGCFQPDHDFECESIHVKVEVKEETNGEVSEDVQSETHLWRQVESLQEKDNHQKEFGVIKGVKKNIYYRTTRLKKCPACDYQFFSVVGFPPKLYKHLKRCHPGREGKVLSLYEKSLRLHK